MFNTIHTTRQSLSLLAPFKILLLSLKVSDLIYDINSSTSHNMCSEENIYPSTVYQMVRESLYTCIDDVFTVYVYILSLNLLSFRTSFWPLLFKEDCFFIFKFKKTFVGKRHRCHLMLNWPWWHVNDWTCGSRVVFSVASVHKCRKRTQVQMQAKENESVFILCVVACICICICICVGVVHVQILAFAIAFAFTFSS